MATEAPAMATDRISYADLYARWEKSNWRATELDFTQDRVDWHDTFTDIERKAALWNYSLFFHGEDSVTDNLSPYIDAAPLEEQKYFLATQQVDEARHAVFFGRFMKEVVGRGDTIGSSLAATHDELTWGFRKTFEHLDKVADRLRRDKSKPSLAAAICMYHIVVEATLAQAGQHFIEGYLQERGIMPGFLEGMENVSRDEQRHIGFGVKLLSDLQKEDPECKYAVADLLREVVPLTVGVFSPPNRDRRYSEVFGKTIENLYEDGMRSLEQKMRAAGMPLEELPGPPPIPLNRSPKERADQAVKLMFGNILGEKTGPPSRDPEVMGLYFDAIANSVDKSAANGGMAIQWDFKDADPWFLRIDNGSSEAGQGRLEKPDVTLKCRFEDWVDISAGREESAAIAAHGQDSPARQDHVAVADAEGLPGTLTAGAGRKTLGARLVDATARRPGGWLGRRAYGGEQGAPPGHEQVFDRVLEWARPLEGKSVLEIGCGGGRLLERVLESGASYAAGLDHSPDMLALSMRRNSEALAEDALRLKLGDAARIPWPDGSFDVVLTANVFFFFEQPNEVIAEIRRVLVPGGRLVIATAPGPLPEPSLRNWWVAVWGRALTVHTDEEMRTMLEGAGFADVEVESEDSLQMARATNP